MVLLTDYQWEGVYRSGEKNLFKEFYAPALTAAVQYDRAVGFFSSSALLSNLAGLSHLIKNDGKMRLIIGHPLEDEEFEAIRRGYRLRSILESFDERLEEALSQIVEEGAGKLELLSYLIAAGKLQVKYAFRKKGMYHEKVGIITDAESNKLVFHGSANETIYALENGYNAESISVFKSWDPTIYELYGKPYEDGFEKLWNGAHPNTITIDVPSDFYSRITDQCPAPDNIEDLNEPSWTHEYDVFFELKSDFNIPIIPSEINGVSFELKEHQKVAIRKWINNKYKGILKLSTGSGKTITALYASARVYKARQQNNRKTALIVAVPYQELAKQWVANLGLFNISPIECWGSKSSWYDDLEREVVDFAMNAIDFLAIVVVNRTLSNDVFQSLLNKLDGDDTLFIGDECHNHGAEKINSKLPNTYYRMGLSATPYRSDEDEMEMPFPDSAKTLINDYYQGIVAEYTLGDAIHDGVLCEYEYHIIPVYLTEEEQDEYETISNRIATIVASSGGSGTSSRTNELNVLCGRRSRLLGAAENKFEALKKLCAQIPKTERRYSLFYCGDGKLEVDSNDEERDVKVVEEVSRILRYVGWLTSRFTSQENARERRNIMENFRSGQIDGLVSMKVLDEGVDVPVCDKAFILASTRNPRQYIQRRGRVLRQHIDKSYSKIYDFVVLPNNRSLASKRLIASELERVDDFVVLAKNRREVEGRIDELNMRS